jgi:predicted TIM-barrel fold metal-dependent hydrolase
MPYIDTHAHIFLQSLPMAAGRRYTPGYDCSAQLYLSQLSRNDIGFGILVQPSFLGTDNSYMLSALDTYPDRLRGIAVVDPWVADSELEAMDQSGVVGIRFNLIGKDISELQSPEIVALLRRIDALGWQVEVQAKGKDLPSLFKAMETFRGPLVIDHFGLPDPVLGVRDPGFKVLLAEATSGRVFVKLSAGYRCGGLDVATCAGALLAVAGPRRLIWGSDWPFTQNEANRSIASMIAEFSRVIPDLHTRDVMDATAIQLFRFA